MVEKKNFEGNPPARELPSDLKKLYEIGFALHWLRPHSKAPIKSGWAIAPKQTIIELIDEFRPGFNPGVKLGAHSIVKNLFLAVVDLDIKSSSIDDYTEALATLYTLFPQVKNAPFLQSGRGNGSSHYYVRLPTPVSGGEVKARSRRLVKVKIPGVPPSAKDAQHLDMDELADGMRMRPAWEIQLLSHGRQAVLVGAVHPDTGRRYIWGRPIEKAEDIPLVEEIPPGINGDPSVPVGADTGDQTAAAPARKRYIFADVTIDDFDLPEHHRAAVVSGEGVSDRSHKLHDITLVLVQRGYPDNAIISLLTNPAYYLGQATWKGGNTTRQRAAAWFDRFQLQPAKQKVLKNSDVFDFDEEPEPTKEGKPPRGPNPLDSANDPDNFKASLPRSWFGRVPMGITDASGWQATLTASPPRKNIPPLIQVTLLNLTIILKNANGPQVILRRDLFSKLDIWCCNTIWGQTKGQQRSSGDDDRLPIKHWISETYGIEPNLNLVDEALSQIALQNAYHPLQNYLNGIIWDGVPRVANFFRTYFGVDMVEPYLSDVTRKFFQACIERAFNPGAAFDHVIVLVGGQGKGKTKAIEILASKAWLIEGLPNLRDKDAALYLQGAWLCEFEELSALGRSDQSVVKGFITRNTDRFRPPYGRTRQDFPRTTVFIGTVDRDQFLVDTAGNRRFWPIQVGKVLDFEGLTRDRDQIWAEAAERFFFEREDWWLSGEAAAQAKAIQEKKRVHSEEDTIKELFIPWFIGRYQAIGQNNTSVLGKNNPLKNVWENRENQLNATMFDFHTIESDEEGKQPETVFDITMTMTELFHAGPFTVINSNYVNQRAAAKVLRELGFDVKHTRRGNVWQLVELQDWLRDDEE